MRYCLLICTIILNTAVHAAEPSLADVRKLYHEAAVNEKSCIKLVTLLKNFQEQSHPLYAGYKGCATMMMAQYVFNPYSKFSYFRSGKQMLEKALAIDKQNFELRFLRFSVQTNIPSFLGYKNSIEEDKRFLISSLRNITDQQLKTMIASFLKGSRYVSIAEKQQLNP